MGAIMETWDSSYMLQLVTDTLAPMLVAGVLAVAVFWLIGYVVNALVSVEVMFTPSRLAIPAPMVFPSFRFPGSTFQ